MTKVLVTGANGFIGRHLCEDLLKSDFRIRAAVRHFSESDLKHENIKYVIAPELGPETDWQPLLGSITHVVHLAGRAHVPDKISKKNPELFHTINVEGTRKLVLDAIKRQIKLFVFLSSVGAIGDRTFNDNRRGVSFFNEETSCNPVGPYGISKLEAERILKETVANSTMKSIIIRPPLVYGPEVGANFLQLMKIVMKEFPLPLGLAKNGKSLIYVRNLTSAIIACLTHEKARGQIFMVADNETLSTRDLIRRLAKAFGKRVFLLPVPISLLKFAAALIGKKARIAKLTDPLIVSSEKISRELGWKQPYSVGEGLEYTAQWFIDSRNKMR